MRILLVLAIALLCVAACERKGPAPWFKVEVSR